MTYNRAFELDQAMEAADRNAKDLEKAAGVHACVEKDKLAVSPRRTTSTQPWYQCGSKHSSTECRFKDSECHHRGKRGYIAKVCRSKHWNDAAKHPQATGCEKPRLKGTQHFVDEAPADTTYALFNVPGERVNPMQVTLKLNRADLQMEMDTGASATSISKAMYCNLWPESTAPPWQKSTVNLCTYTGEGLRSCMR